MPETPDWNQLLEAGRQFGTMTRAEAERRVQELVRRGEVAQERFQTAVDELLDRSRSAADDLRGVVRSEIRRQMRSLGLVTRDDLERLEARLRADRSGGPTKKAAGKKATAKKTPGKKTATNKATAKKSAAKKTAAKKTAAKTSAAKTSAAGRARGGAA